MFINFSSIFVTHTKLIIGASLSKLINLYNLTDIIILWWLQGNRSYLIRVNSFIWRWSLIEAVCYLRILLYIHCRWAWFLYCCIIRKCHPSTQYWRNCRRSDRQWISGYHSYIILFVIGRWCAFTGIFLQWRQSY